MARGRNIYDEAKLQGRLWTPLAIMPNVHAWYDASDQSTLTVTSGVVDAIADKSGNGNNLSKSGSPLASVYDGINCVYTNNGGNAFDSGSFIFPTECCLIIATRQISSPSTQSSVFGTETNVYFYSTSSSTWRGKIYGTGDTGSPITLSANDHIGMSMIARMRFSEADGVKSGKINSEPEVEDDTFISHPSPDGLHLLSQKYHTATNQLFFEFVMLNVNDLRLIELVEGYMNWKCFPAHRRPLTDGEHPFVSRPPMIGD